MPEVTLSNEPPETPNGSRRLPGKPCWPRVHVPFGATEDDVRRALRQHPDSFVESTVEKFRELRAANPAYFPES